jgi:hypothetical protein
VDLESTASELYGLPPGEFVTARSAAEKAARGDGDRELAAQIRALGKPTAAAWVANQLVRQHPDEISALRELGAGLREATASLEGQQLRELSKQQNQVVAALVAQARTLARAAGQPMSEATERGVDATLRAALADEQIADQLAAGQLTTALEHVGFAGTLAEGAVPKPAAGPSKPDDLAERRRRREEIERARATLSDARSAERSAAATLRDAEAAVREAEAALKEAGKRRDRARSAADAAAERVQEATDALDALDD